MKVRDIIRVIEKDGWVYHSQKGSHRQFTHPAKAGRVTVPGKPGKDLHPKTQSFDTGAGADFEREGPMTAKYAIVIEKLRRLAKVTQLYSNRMTPVGNGNQNRIGNSIAIRNHHPRWRVCSVGGRAGDIIHAAGVRVGSPSSPPTARVGYLVKRFGGLSSRGNPLELETQIQEVIRADL